MKNRYLLIAAASLAFSTAFPSSAQAQTLDFNFSFTANLVEAPDLLPGTVTGEILGLQNNTANQIPTEITITSAPAQLGFTLPYTFPASDAVGTWSGFTVENGVITAAQIDMQDPNNASYGNPFVLGIDDDLNILQNEMISGNPSVVNYSGFSGMTFSAAPEPSSWALGLIALGGVFSLRRRILRA